MQYKKTKYPKIRSFFKGILEELLYDHKFNLYLYDEDGKEIAKKESVPFIPPIGYKIRINDQYYFEVREPYIQESFGVIYLFGKKIPA